MAVLRESRTAVLALLQDTRYSLPERLAAMLVYSSGVEGALCGGALPACQPEALPTSGKKLASPPDVSGFLDFYRRLEILTPQWRSRLAQPVPGAWFEEIAALARYGVQRYWLQAVSDGEIWARVKFIISGALLVNLLGGDTVSTAQLYSKEIENDPENVAAILDGAYSAPALSDSHLLGLLLRDDDAPASAFKNFKKISKST